MSARNRQRLDRVLAERNAARARLAEATTVARRFATMPARTPQSAWGGHTAALAILTVLDPTTGCPSACDENDCDAGCHEAHKQPPSHNPRVCPGATRRHDPQEKTA